MELRVLAAYGWCPSDIGADKFEAMLDDEQKELYKKMKDGYIEKQIGFEKVEGSHLNSKISAEKKLSAMIDDDFHTTVTSACKCKGGSDFVDKRCKADLKLDPEYAQWMTVTLKEECLVGSIILWNAQKNMYQPVLLRVKQGGSWKTCHRFNAGTFYTEADKVRLNKEGDVLGEEYQKLMSNQRRIVKCTNDEGKIVHLLGKEVQIFVQKPQQFACGTTDTNRSDLEIRTFKVFGYCPSIIGKEKFDELKKKNAPK